MLDPLLTMYERTIVAFSPADFRRCTISNDITDDRKPYRVLASIKHWHADRGHQFVLLQSARLIVPLLLLHISPILLLHVVYPVFVAQNEILLFLTLALLPQPISHFRIRHVGIDGRPDGRVICAAQHQRPRHHRHVL